ncbi:initiator tRNA phosphoribosyl transferase, partial [Mycena pura]
MYDLVREQADALAILRKESLDIYSRLHSIAQDVAFVNDVHDAYPGIPILPNLRCGAWYTDPAIRQAADVPAYFKSTDGHYGSWRFSLRRPNLHLLPLAAAHDGKGIVLVDSTRAGKRLPDALSKTVPIWCAVVNRAVLLRRGNSGSDWDTALHTPPGAVSAQEAAQIAARLEGWSAALAASSYALADLPRPLRPLWVTPAGGRPVPPAACIPVICVSASGQVPEDTARRAQGFAYVQGAGDDHELWGMGLTPELFWRHRVDLLAAVRADLPILVARLVAEEAHTHLCPASGTAAAAIARGPTPVTRVYGRVLVCAAADLVTWAPLTAHVVVVAAGTAAHLLAAPLGTPILRIDAWAGKKGQMQLLHDILPRATAFVAVQLGLGHPVCVTCDTGTDLSVGIALAMLQMFFDESGSLIVDSAQRDIANKQSIRTRLEWIIASRPEANPSRSTLKRVNEFLLSDRAFRAPL